VSARHIFIDETKRRGYLMVASIHAATDVLPMRTVVRNLLLPKQRYLHMKDERDGRRRTIAEAFVEAQVRAVVYRAGAPHRTDLQRRAACLRAIVEDNSSAADVRLILHQDDTLLSFDNQRLIEYTREFDCRHTLHYGHRRADAELLLGIPDTIAWCCAKGGEWQRLVQPVLIRVRDI